MVELINAGEDLPVGASPALGEGRHAPGTIHCGGEARPGDEVTLDVDRSEYWYVVPEGDIPERFVDRLNYLVDHAEDPKVIVERKTDQSETLGLVHRDAGPIGHSLPFSISVTRGTPTTMEVSGEMLSLGTVTYRANLTAKGSRATGPRSNCATPATNWRPANLDPD